MRIQSALRAVVLLFGVGVVATIYWNWRPAPSPETTAPEPEVNESTEEDAASRPARQERPEEEIASQTDNIHIVESKNGREVFAIWADEQTDYVDGWNNWASVRVVIYGDDGDDDDIEIRSDRARTAGADGSDFDEVVFIGGVVATLPSGGEFNTHRIHYDAVTGEVSNCNRNTLRYAGLEVRADCMQFQTGGAVTSATAVAEELRMWQDLAIRTAADEGAGSMPQGLTGRADELRFRPGGETVYLDGSPQVLVDESAIGGDSLVLDVGPEANELRGLTAEGNARVRLSSTESVDGDAEGGARGGRGRTLSGDVVEMSFGEDGGIDAVAARGGAGEAGLAQLLLRGFGQLDARQLEVAPGERLQASARGDVRWQPQRTTEGLGGLTAGELRLSVAENALDSLDASGGVAASFGDDSAAAREFSGARLVLGWADDELSRGAWPEGVSLAFDGRTLDADRARLEPETGAWVLNGDARPRVRAPEFDISASEFVLDPAGSLSADGDVTGQIGGGYLTAAAALFGAAEAVALSASSAQVSTTGSLRLTGRVQIVWQEQSLVADDVLLESEPGRLRATGEVELVAAAGDEGEFVTVSAENLLVEEATSEVRVAGAAELRQGRRRIAAETMVVAVDEAGEWSDVAAETGVIFEDDRARGSGTELEYSMQSRDLRLAGDDLVAAVFVYEGVDPPAEYRSNEELRVSYSGDAIVIESTEDGRATTSVVPQTTGTVSQDR